MDEKLKIIDLRNKIIHHKLAEPMFILLEMAKKSQRPIRTIEKPQITVIYHFLIKTLTFFENPENPKNPENPVINPVINPGDGIFKNLRDKSNPAFYLLPPPASLGFLRR